MPVRARGGYNIRMRSKRILAALIATAALNAAPVAQQRRAADPVVEVYKTSTCGCCSKWIDHLRSAGFSVSFIDMPQAELDKLKAKRGVPAVVHSCHTALVDRYVLEGHIPASEVKRLLREKPSVVGIAVPGMPPGSPGMEVAERGLPTYNVLSFDKQGKTRLFSTQKP